MIRTLVSFCICFLVVAGITTACVISANTASKDRFEKEIQTLTAHDEARNRYSMHPLFIFDEIDFRNGQSENKRAAIAEYDASYIDTDKTLGILKLAAILLATAFLINYIVTKLAVEQRKSRLALDRIRQANLAARTQPANTARFSSSLSSRPPGKVLGVKSTEGKLPD